MRELHFVNQKKFKEVDRIEPKRAFIISQLIRNSNKGNKLYLPDLDNIEFQKKLNEAKEIMLDLTEKELDGRIHADAPRYKRRLRYYNFVNWYKGVINVNEVGIWRKAGGFPIEWTYGSLTESVSIFNHSIKDKSNKKVAGRAKRAIPRINKHLEIIKKEKYLYPIILPGASNGRGINGRPHKHFKKMTGDIDDGCMRALALVINGQTTFNAYIGISSDI